MGKQILGELIAGALVACSFFIPDMLFGQYLSYVDVAEFAAAAEISRMTVGSILAAAAIYYFAWRILRFVNRRQ